MNSLTPKQYVELFHLLFLDQLGRKIDKTLYAVKGGCNLRFFLKSIRYSQDIDIDIDIIRKDTLETNVNKIIESNPFRLILGARKIEITEISEPKQTETTQRWKIHLKVPTSALPINTKIEFSRRGLDDPVSFDTINAEIAKMYSLSPIWAVHYTPESALHQKIIALASRNQTQARDVFDLYHLLQTGTSIRNFSNKHYISLAHTNAQILSHNEFISQVVAYLPDDFQNQYNDPAIWAEIVLTVIEYLEKLL